MLLEILKYPDLRLNKVAEEVPVVTSSIRDLAKNMIETMYQAEGVGLAAPQVGAPLRMLVMDPDWRDMPRNPRVIINPRLKFDGEIITSPNEGCLSVPLGYRADVPRYSVVHLKGLDIDGNSIEATLEGFPAIVLQHETDHLDGKLFIDKISHLKRNLYDAKVKKWMKNLV